jgi:hypothetical protein
MTILNATRGHREIITETARTVLRPVTATTMFRAVRGRPRRFTAPAAGIDHGLPPRGARIMTAEPNWRPLRQRIALELQALARNDHDAVIVSEQETATTPQTHDRTRTRGPLRTLGRRLGFIHVHPFPKLRFVQFAIGKDPNTIYAECVGSTAWDGSINLTPETDRRLRALGWLSPDDPGYLDYSFGRGAPMYRLSTPDTDTEHLADLAIESLALLGLTPLSPIEVETR